jgi:hypothetical protein
MLTFPSMKWSRLFFFCNTKRVDANWSSVTYSYDDTNIAMFFVAQDGKCKELGAQSSGLYTTYCDDSTRTFYLTINNLTLN